MEVRGALYASVMKEEEGSCTWLLCVLLFPRSFLCYSQPLHPLYPVSLDPEYTNCTYFEIMKTKCPP